MNIYALSTLNQSVSTLEILITEIPLKGVIGLTERGPTDKISGYVYMSDFCAEHNLDFIQVKSYNLKNTMDKQRLLDLDIDILLVFGWQRLVPQWLIDHCKVAVLGVHGSARGITEGRGRSPQNWALLLGEEVFHLSLFLIDSGIDSGNIIDTCVYALTEFDDISTSYYKVSWLTAKMIASNIKKGTLVGSPQRGTPKYLPKRVPQDGEIDWNRSVRDIYNFVRALTHPFPGAFSKLPEGRIRMWKVRPFGLNDDKYKNGEIVKVYHDGRLLIKASDELLFVDDYSVEPEKSREFIGEGVVLSSCDFRIQIKGILDRHYEKYPDLEVVQELHNITRGRWEET